MPTPVPDTYSAPAGRKLHAGRRAKALAGAAVGAVLASGALSVTGGGSSQALAGAAAGVVSASGSLAGGSFAVSFSLVSPTTQTAPFTVGHAFRMGDVPSGSGVAVAGATAQVLAKNAWPDGSLKFALISGIAALTANVPATVSLSVGTASSGTALTTADLKATGITASIGCGAFGTVSWATTDWDTPHQTWASGHRMSSWIYRKPVGSDAHLVGWLEVRLYAGGAVEVLPWIENGYLKVAGSTNKSATYTFDLGGTQRFSGAINLLHHQRTPLLSGSAVSHWLGSDPQVTPKHNAQYMAEAGYVPSYISGVTFAEFPAKPADSKGLTITFTPLEQGDLPSAMGDGGPHQSIGLIANWDAAYLTSTSTLNAYKGMIFNVYRMGRYGVHFRDENTNRPVKFTDRPQLAITDSDGTFKYGAYGTLDDVTVGGSGGAPPVYSPAHDPSPGFVAYLVTGSFYMLEELQLTTGAQYLHRGWFRNGTDGRIDTKYLQIREGAWSVRTLFQCAAATPDADALRADYLNSCQKNVEFQKSIFLDQSNHPFGIPVTGTGSAPPSGQGFEIDFWVMSWLQAWTLRVLTGAAQTNLEAYAAYTARATVGRLGGTRPDEYLYADATGYKRDLTGINLINPTTTVTGYPPDTVTSGSGPYNPHWGAVYQQAMGTPNPGTNDPLQGYVNDPGGGWGGIHLAAAMAASLGLPGATAAWARFTGASNYSTYVDGATFNRFVSFAAQPITVIGSSFADVTYLPALNEWGTIPNSTLSSSGVMQTNGADIISSWCDAIVNTIGVYDGTTFVPGTHLVLQSGGHTIDYDEIYAYGPLEADSTSVRKWRRLRDRTVPSIVNVNQNGAGTPVSGHSYKSMVFDPRRNEMLRTGILYRYTDSGVAPGTYRFSFRTSNPNVAQPWSKGADVPSTPAYAAVLDLVADKVFYRPANRSEVAVYDRAANTFAQGFGKAIPMNDDSAAAALDEKRGLFYQIGNGHGFYRTNNGAANDYYTPSTTGTGPTLTGYGAVLRDPIADCFVVWRSGKTLYKLTPPASNPYQGGNAWTWSSSTPAGGATPNAADANGTFGRFAFAMVNGKATYLLMNAAAASINIYRAS